MILALDVGGTSIKSILLSPAGANDRWERQEVRIDPDASGDIILQAFGVIIRSAGDAARNARGTLAGVGIGMPGPCDYSRGVSLMRHKYQGIHGLQLEPELRRRAGVAPEVAFAFGHDASMFLLGEYWRGAAAGYERILGLTLGTGIGAAFLQAGTLICTPTGMPIFSVWNQPYRDGIVEDYASKRALMARYHTLAGRRDDGPIDVRDIARRGIQDRDPHSLQAFFEFGEHLGEALVPAVSRFGPDCIVIGGQIAKAFALFGEPLKERLHRRLNPEMVVGAAHIDMSALYGAAKLVGDRL
jgi:glucokinase